MKKKVFILFHEKSDEEFRIIGIYSSLNAVEKAKQHCSELCQDHGNLLFYEYPLNKSSWVEGFGVD